MSEIKTISRNATRKIISIKAQNLRCLAFTLAGNFTGHEVDPNVAWNELANDEDAKLRTNPQGGYTIHVHSNHWYELRPDRCADYDPEKLAHIDGFG